MEPLRLAETHFSPEVNLDKDRSRFEFFGKSFPEDAKEFFNPIIDWFMKYVESPNRETTVIFKLDYFNTASSKKIVDLLNVLKEIHKQKKSIIINWYYKSDDEDMLETGETFSEIVNLPFKFFPY
ncbi:MAG TPA: DUF1987 domain-containing protein [Tenuifilaceae bacterium]|nr:DUF1987 domain-containing protein [Tenuifilaceae bacterium]HPE19182.1 DUF1987 domain-containing protein [Tenuifilaceae bacterium]HPJ46546.1 DUF1987 domain-containing protein [Tenuifilaceae bacterium]HPQ35227.1 DUF1987 domain-containing protein [Tenuifilaceae bacterium]HRX67453.1 DUF1987 domain-containing protein [Tenuifilaceae bacterium]